MGEMEDNAISRLRQAVRRTAHATRDRTAGECGPEAADDVAGTFATDDVIGFDPFPFLRALHDSGSRAVVIGQVAGIMHGSTELTGDLDLLWDGTLAQARAIREALIAANCLSLPDLTGAQTAYQVTGAGGDLCTPELPWGDLHVASCLDRALSAHDSTGFTVHYVALTDLIGMRRALGRPKDLRRAVELEALLSVSPDEESARSARSR